VSKDKEPITPFISKIRALSSRGVSCILVIGGSGDYFDVADAVVCMDCFRPKDVTAEAQAIARSFGGAAALNGATADFGDVTARVPTSIYPGEGPSYMSCFSSLQTWFLLALLYPSGTLMRGDVNRGGICTLTQ
jgi:hypothetical protein